MDGAVAFAVDPLLQKTSAQFDEGGAKGLLLNSLSIFQDCEIVFDSWEVPERLWVQAETDVHQDASVNLSFMKGKPSCALRHLFEQAKFCKVTLVPIDASTFISFKRTILHSTR